MLMAYIPAPTANPMPAVAHIPAAVVSPPDYLFLENDGTRTDESDTADYLCGNTAGVQRHTAFLDDFLKTILGIQS